MNEQLLKFTTNQLADNSAIADIQKETNKIIRRFDVKGASQLSRFLRSKILDNSLLFKIYEDIIASLDFIRIGLLDENQTLELIKNYFIVTFSFPSDILTPLDIIKRKLIGLSLIDQELLREKINKVIKHNNNLLTKEKLVLSNKEEKLDPTIANWLLDYDLRLTGTQDRSLARAEYLTNSSNVASLVKEEKDKVKQLIKVYDFINTSSLIPSAWPEDLIINWENGCRFIISEGETVVSLSPIKEDASFLNDFKFKEEEKVNNKKIKSLEEKYLEESDLNNE
ncbi:MAG: hypothetical protein KGZ85_05420 [Ignavibacterium sp.]|nr:hypothetical protein [Ignavibacterium sp.]